MINKKRKEYIGIDYKPIKTREKMPLYEEEI